MHKLVPDIISGDYENPQGRQLWQDIWELEEPVECYDECGELLQFVQLGGKCCQLVGMKQ